MWLQGEVVDIDATEEIQQHVLEPCALKVILIINNLKKQKCSLQMRQQRLNLTSQTLMIMIMGHQLLNQTQNRVKQYFDEKSHFVLSLDAKKDLGVNIF